MPDGPPYPAGLAGRRVSGVREPPQRLARAMRAAFHGAPADALDVLSGLRSPAATWLTGVAAGALGRYGEALDVLESMIAREPASRSERRYEALAAATLAAVRRQLGDYRAGERADRRGLVLAAPLGAAGAEPVADCQVGLVADAVGRGEPHRAADRLARAERAVRAAGGWRPGVRLSWVRAEVALLADRPAEAARHAGRALAAAQAADAPRHVAKSLLFLGVAQVQTGDARAGGTLRRAVLLSASLRTVPLLWPACAVLADTLPGGAAARCRTAARAAVREIADHLPEPLRTRWLAAPDRAAVLDRR